MNPCPECARPTTAEAAVCANCGHDLTNGIPRPGGPFQKPTPPPEVSNWVITPTPPEMIEEFRRTFNEEEFIAELRAIEQTGGVSFEEIIGEIEEMVKRRE